MIKKEKKDKRARETDEAKEKTVGEAKRKRRKKVHENERRDTKKHAQKARATFFQEGPNEPKTFSSEYFFISKLYRTAGDFSISLNKRM